MIAGVADTHTALDDPRLSVGAGDFINAAAAARRKIALSAISLAEVVYLIEKDRLPLSVFEDLANALADPDHVFTEAACTAVIVRAMRQIPRADIPDMPDRIIAATALHFEVPVISRDGRIRASQIKTVW